MKQKQTHISRTRRLLPILLILAAIAVPLHGFSEDSGMSDKEAQLKKKKEAEALKQKEIEEAIKEEMDLDFNEIYDKLVIVKCQSELGGKSSGSGFIAQMGDKTYLFTGKGVIFGAEIISFQTASGRKLSPRSVELSTTSNIARLLLQDESGFEISDSLTMDLPVGVFGNSEGGGVVTEIFGKISKVGSDALEISAPFVNGNSGSPVLNADQQVIAMASHVKYTSKKDDNGNKIVKRICHRLNNNEWQTVNWKKYNKKYGQIYLKQKQVVAPVINIVQQWIDNPYGLIYATDVKDPEITEFLRIQQELIDTFIANRKYTSVTQGHLNSMNSGIKRHVANSSVQLQIVCDKYAKRMKFLKSYKDPTGFLQSEFQSYVDYFNIASKSVGFISTIYSSDNFYSFKKED